MAQSKHIVTVSLDLDPMSLTTMAMAYATRDINSGGRVFVIGDMDFDLAAKEGLLINQIAPLPGTARYWVKRWPQMSLRLVHVGRLMGADWSKWTPLAFQMLGDISTLSSARRLLGPVHTTEAAWYWSRIDVPPASSYGLHGNG